MIFLKKCFVNTTSEIDLLPIIHDIRYAIRDAGVTQGLVTIAVTEPGAGLLLCEPLPELLDQLKAALEIFPGEGVEATTKSKEKVLVGPWVKATMLGRTLSIPFNEGDLLIALREEILLVDFEEEAKRRSFHVQIFGEAGEEQGTQQQQQKQQPGGRR